VVRRSYHARGACLSPYRPFSTCTHDGDDKDLGILSTVLHKPLLKNTVQKCTIYIHMIQLEPTMESNGEKNSD